MCHLSESLWTTNSNERQADSHDELSEWCKDKRDSTALGQGSDVPMFAAGCPGLCSSLCSLCECLTPDASYLRRGGHSPIKMIRLSCPVAKTQAS